MIAVYAEVSIGAEYTVEDKITGAVMVVVVMVVAVLVHVLVVDFLGVGEATETSPNGRYPVHAGRESLPQAFCDHMSAPFSSDSRTRCPAQDEP